MKNRPLPNPSPEKRGAKKSNLSLLILLFSLVPFLLGGARGGSSNSRRRIPDFTKLKEEVVCWCEEYNRKETWIDWRFKTEDARIKLKRIYPSIKS